MNEQVDAFRVDGIPHLAMVNGKGEVETAIIGAVPKEVSSCSVCGCRSNRNSRAIEVVVTFTALTSFPARRTCFACRLGTNTCLEYDHISLRLRHFTMCEMVALSVSRYTYTVSCATAVITSTR